jgi:integrase
MTANPARAVKPRTPPKEEVEIPSDEEVARILASFEGDLLAFVRASFNLGTRVAETSALKWSDIKGDRVSITRAAVELTKDGKRVLTLEEGKIGTKGWRRIKVDPVTLAALKSVERTGPYIFGGDEPRWPTAASRTFKRHTTALLKAKQIDSDYSIHACRHYMASTWIAGGADIIKVSKRLGHTNAATTLRQYGHLIEDADDGFAEQFAV